MVQEVQTGIGIYNETTLETIEAVGTSSRRIIEGRQTRGIHYVSQCRSRGTAEWTYAEPGPRQSPYVSANQTISGTDGVKMFAEENGGIRVPEAGTYQISVTWLGGTSTFQTTIYVFKGDNSTGELLYSEEYNTRTEKTTTLIADLGKFETVHIYYTYYYSGTSAGASFGDLTTLTLQQL